MAMNLAWIWHLESWKKMKENADRVLDIQKYVNRQHKKLFKKEIYESSGDSGTRNRK